jgi:hypothetical protein
MRAPALALFCAACTPSFASPSDVFDLRVLAVQAEPPEAQYDSATVQDVHIRVLAVDPLSDGFATMTATLCAPTDSRRCETALGPQYSLGAVRRQGGTEFHADVPGFLIKPVKDFAESDDRLKGLGGIRVMFAFSVSDGPGPLETVAGEKILLYSKAGGTPNHNPLLTGVRLTDDAQDAGTLDAGQTLKLTRGVQRGLRPILAPGAREEYDVTDLRGNQVHLTEQPRYSFFTTPGAELDRDGADEPLDGVAPPDGLVRIQANQACAPAAVCTLWIVVRDGRGGESWISFPWTTL